jgi:tRNA-splicing ligase RtcB
MNSLKNKLTIFGNPEQAAINQIARCLEDDRCKIGVITSDAHKGYSLNVGGVVAMKDAISPQMCGSDNSCGNKAVKLDVDPIYVKNNISRIMDEVFSKISFGVGRKNNESVDHKLFDSDLWQIEPIKDLKDLAYSQLGTVGSGNHYVDLFIDEQNFVWIGVHFGSRGFGYKMTDYFMKKGGAKDGADEKPLIFDINSELGELYFKCSNLASEYAYAGRDWVCSKVAEILGGNIIDSAHNNHNSTWVEEHFGEKYYVVRKGATPCFPNQRSFVGASMGEPSVIIEGVDSEQAKISLYSTVHGAGRVMGRMEAKGKIDRKTGEVKREGKVSKDMMREWIRNSQVELRGGDVDESPHCYKRLNEVLTYHADSIKILHTLKPIGVAMAGKNDIDPYKD